jgi:hypothetical protein
MLKKVLIFSFLLMMIPINAFASGQSGRYYPPSDSDFYQKKVATKVYISAGIVKLRMTQRDYDTGEVIGVITWNVKQGSNIWIDETCRGALAYEFLDSEGVSQSGAFIRGKTDIDLKEGSCAGDFVKPSDYNEEKDQYAGDTFGGTKPKLTNPPTADGSGGTGSTGFEGTDDGTGDGGGSDPGTGDGSGGTGSECSACDQFSCPGWSDYMGKLDEIGSKIPPAPNWDDVANKFRDSIVPAVMSDLEDMLGQAPASPSTPSKPPSLNDRGIKDKAPSMPSNPDLDDSGFNEQDIKDQAPQIPVREDPTGGFDLIQNPVDSLPDLPTDDFPTPGQTDPGEWGGNTPKEPENNFPDPPKEGSGEISNPPTPGGTGGEPPIPGDGTGDFPTPGGDSGEPPTPDGDSGTPPEPSGDDGMPGTGCYKPNPGAADGSGSC